MAKHLLLAALTLAVLSPSQTVADMSPMDSWAFPRGPFILVQHSPQICTAGCERKYQFCLQVVKENAMDRQILQLGLDKCESNYQLCVKICS